MYSMRHVKGAAMRLNENLERLATSQKFKPKDVEEYQDAMNNWMKNNDLDGVIQNADIKYTYDHIAVKLISQHAWVRVPHWIPGVETHPTEGIVWEQKRI